MSIVIRENENAYMKELKAWLADMADVSPEEMSGFFSKRADDYEEHMSIWKEAYLRFAELLPAGCERILDLGCGTGLELDEIWKRNPDVAVTGVDLCPDMLIKLCEKHGNKKLETVCEDYFRYDMGEKKWDAVISFESFHHFLPKQKEKLYEQIFRSLKDGAVFLLGDYLACCEEEEELLRRSCLEKRTRLGIQEDVFIHFDIPLTLEHELELLSAAGFESARVVDSVNGATIVIAKKKADSSGAGADDACTEQKPDSGKQQPDCRKNRYVRI